MSGSRLHSVVEVLRTKNSWRGWVAFLLAMILSMPFYWRFFQDFWFDEDVFFERPVLRDSVPEMVLPIVFYCLVYLGVGKHRMAVWFAGASVPVFCSASSDLVPLLGLLMFTPFGLASLFIAKKVDSERFF